MKNISETLSKYKLNEEDDSSILAFVRDANIVLSEASKTIKYILTDGDFYRYWKVLDSAYLEVAEAYDHLLEARRQYAVALSALERDKHERERTGRA